MHNYIFIARRSIFGKLYICIIYVVVFCALFWGGRRFENSVVLVLLSLAVT